MKILKKILAFTTTLALSVSVMAFSMTASAEAGANYKYNGKTYDWGFEDTSEENWAGTDKTYCFIGSNTGSSFLFVGGDGVTVDIYGSLYVTLNITFDVNSPVINIMKGGSLSVSKLNVSNHLTINNYGGTITAPPLLLEQSNITYNDNTSLTIDEDGDETTNKIETSTKLLAKPTYTVTIPEKIDFETQDRALKNDSDADRLVSTTAKLKYEAANLNVNEKILTVKVSKINPLTATVEGRDYSINYKLTTDGTEISAGTTLVSVGGKDSNRVVYETEVPITATLDKSDIEVAGDYAGSVIFTVALTDE